MTNTLIEIWAGIATVGMGYFAYRSEVYRLCLEDSEKFVKQYRDERKAWIERSKCRDETLKTIIETICGKSIYADLSAKDPTEPNERVEEV